MASTLHTESSHGPAGYSRLVLLWLGLLALTGLTVALAGIELGSLVVVTALTIASTKAVLVLNVFMHLKFENLILRLMVGGVFLLFGDVLMYHAPASLRSY